MKQAVWILYI